jgi:hypothetical protein
LTTSSPPDQASLETDVTGEYVVQLAVSDPIGPGFADTLVITATDPDSYAEVQITSGSETIVALPPESVTTGGNQEAMTNFLIQAVDSIEKGKADQATSKLEQAIERTDGCALRGVPDGNGPGRDWVTTCEAQANVYPLLLEALNALSQ